MRSYRPLIWLWGMVLSLAVAGAATLQFLGPPEHGGPGASASLSQDSAIPPAVTDAAPPPSPPSEDAISSAATAVPTSPASAALDLASSPPAPAARERRSPAVSDAPVPARPYHQRVRQARREALPDETAATPIPQPPRPAERQPGAFIGVYATGPDGVRVFRSNP